MKTTKEILTERAKTHGSFATNARVSQGIKDLLSRQKANRSDVLNEGIDAIAGKLARIASGDPLEIDHWEDIAGYATLVVTYLKRTAPIAPAPSVPSKPIAPAPNTYPASEVYDVL